MARWFQIDSLLARLPSAIVVLKMLEWGLLILAQDLSARDDS